MYLLLQLAIFIAFLVIIYQDFKERKIHWILIPVILSLLFFISARRIGVEETIKNGYVNLIFFGIQLMLVSVYYYLKHRKWVNIVDSYLGLGDILFIVAISPYFSPANFILFYLAALIFTLLFYFAFGPSARGTKLIPLAGMVALFMILVNISLFFLPGQNLQQNNFISNLVSLWTSSTIYH